MMITLISKVGNCLILLLQLLIITVNTQFCTTPIYLISSPLSGQCVSNALPQHYLSFNNAQLGVIDGQSKFSMSFWYQPQSIANAVDSSQNYYRIFRVAGDPSDDTPTTTNGVLLGLQYSTSTIDVFQMKVTYAKLPSTAETPVSYDFPYNDDDWLFIYMGLDYSQGSIVFYIWDPVIYPPLMIHQPPITEPPGFNTPPNWNAQLQIFYWGTQKSICGTIDDFRWYLDFLETDYSHNWINLAFIGPTTDFSTLHYLKFEDNTGTNIRDSANPSSPGTLVNGSWNNDNIQFTTGDTVTVPAKIWSVNNPNNKGFSVSFWVRHKMSVNADAEIDDGDNDVILLSRTLSSPTYNFKILFYQNGNQFIPKIRLEDTFFQITNIMLAPDTWYHLTVRVANPQATRNLNNIMLDVYLNSGQGLFHKMTNLTNAYDLTQSAEITIGNTLNDITGNFYLSNIYIDDLYPSYINIAQGINCQSNCQYGLSIIKTGATFSNHCYNCFGLLYLDPISHSCVANCPESIFGINNNKYYICKQCDIKCATCLNAGACTSCVSGEFLNQQSSVCQNPCPVNYAQNTTSQICDLCGNGNLDGTEQCDDQNFINNDGCSTCIIDNLYVCNNQPSVCQLKCGDGKRTPDEDCDDGNHVNSDGCTNCKIDNGYQCAGGSLTTPDTCNKICGNGKREAGEECDDGDQINANGCTNCKVDKGWLCTGGTTTHQDTCINLCGNGVRDFLEECDDNNSNAGDGCTFCTVDFGYICNGGSPSTPDTCVKRCGDGIRQEDEFCDTGGVNPGCINCVVTKDYVCTGLSPDVCTLLPNTCGDGKKKSTEGCDDGNAQNSDGCSSTCLVELGFICQGGSTISKDYCSELCGDGIKVGKEQCDDGNQVGGDGCSEYCKIENNYKCSGGNSTHKDTCSIQCGDGFVDTNEECDDENLEDFDGCSSYCTVELGYSCQILTGSTKTHCFKCVQDCISCVNKTFSGCTNCKPGFVVDNLRQSCQEDCYSNFFADYGTQQCKRCFDENCDQCLNDQNGNCFRCISTYFLIQGTCWDQCPQGYYNFYDFLLGNKCLPCTYPCGQCTSATICQKCADTFQLDKATKKVCLPCGLGDKCVQCNEEHDECQLCAQGYNLEGGSDKNPCSLIPNSCGDGLMSLAELCDDGNTNTGDGCSSQCTIEDGWNCIFVRSDQVSECYEKKPPTVSADKSSVFYNVVLIKFNRPLRRQFDFNAQNGLPPLIRVKIPGIDIKQYTYTLKTRDDLQTIEVSFEFAVTIQNRWANITFVKPRSVYDKYNYTLPADQQPMNATLNYYIHYEEYEMAQAITMSWVCFGFVVFNLISNAFFIRNYEQGRLLKILEVVQWIGAFRYVNLRYDLYTEQLLERLDYFNFAFVINPFKQLLTLDLKTLDKDPVRFKQLNFLSLALFEGIGRMIVIVIIVLIMHIIIRFLDRIVSNQYLLLLEQLNDLWNFSIYVRLLDYFMFQLMISVFLSLTIINFKLVYCIISFSLSIIVLIAVLLALSIILKKFLFYRGLERRPDLFKHFYCLYDGVNIKPFKNRIFMACQFFQKFIFAGILVFCTSSPFAQVIIGILLRGIPLIYLLFQKAPFHFDYQKKREVILEIGTILITGITLGLNDSESEKSQKLTCGYAMVFFTMAMLIYNLYVNIWSVKQEDIFFDPPQIILTSQQLKKQEEKEAQKLSNSQKQKSEIQNKQAVDEPMQSGKLMAIQSPPASVMREENNPNQNMLSSKNDKQKLNIVRNQEAFQDDEEEEEYEEGEEEEEAAPPNQRYLTPNVSDRDGKRSKQGSSQQKNRQQQPLDSNADEESLQHSDIFGVKYDQSSKLKKKNKVN